MAKSYWGPLKTVGEQLATGRAMLRQTTYGRGDVISVDVDSDGSVKFFIRSLNEKFDTIEKAIGRAASIGLNEVVSFDRAPGFSGSKHVARHGSNYNQAAEMYNTIYDSLQKASKTDLKRLQDAGIDTTRLRELALDIFTVQDKKGDSKRLASIIIDNMKKNILSGSVSMTDDGARVLRFRLGDTSLTSYQISLLRNFVGQGRLNPKAFGSTLGVNDVGVRTFDKFFDKLAKIGKREKGVLAPRDISLTASDLLLSDLLGEDPSEMFDGTKIRKVPRNLVNQMRINKGHKPNVLLLDPAYDLLAKFAGIDFFPAPPTSGTSSPRIPGGMDINAKVARGKLAYYRGKDPLNFFGDLLDKKRFPTTDRDKLLTDLQEAIRNFADPNFNPNYNELVTGPQTTSNLKSTALKDFLLENFAGGSSSSSKVLTNQEKAFRKGLVDDIYKSIEVAFDGSALMNDKFFKGRLLPALKKERDFLLNQIGTNPANVEELRQRVGDLNDDIRLIESNQLYQFTGRGYHPDLGVFKTAWANTRFSSELEDFMMIVTPYDFKHESSILKTPVLTFSNLGDRSPRVYLDAMAEAFQADIFLDDGSIENMRRLSALKLQEVEDAIRANYVPEEIIKNLQRSLEVNISNLPSHLRENAIKNRQYMQSLMDLYRSGIDIRTSPQLINLMYSFYATDVVRNRRGEIQAVSPLSRTFAIASEASFVDESILGKGFETIDFKVSGKKISAEIVNFRSTGHRLGFAPQVAPQIKQALGGYDNDDTVASTMRMYEDSKGNKKLGFYITRGPTGFQEAVFTRAVFDIDTLNDQFGEDEYFIKTLEDMLDGADLSSPEKSVQQALLNSLRSKYKTRENIKIDIPGGRYTSGQFEEAIVQVFDVMQRNNLYSPSMMSEKELLNIARSGATALRVDPAKFGAGTRGESGVSKLLPDYQGDLATKIMTRATKVDATEEVLKIIRDNPVETSLKTELLAKANDTNALLGVLESAINDYQNIGPGVSKSAMRRIETRGQHAMALLEELSQTVQLQGAARGSDILGVYVDRSMIAGSMMPQFEEAYANLGKRARKFAKENLGFALLEPEEAIDLSTTFSGLRELEDVDEIARITGADPNKLRVIAGRIAALQQEAVKNAGGKQAVGFMDLIGQDIIGQAGRSIGFMRAAGINDPQLQLGIDKVWLETRLQKGDAELMLRQFVQGISEAKGLGMRVSKEILQAEEQVNKLLEKTSQSKMYQYVLDNFALSEDSKFAKASKRRLVASQFKMYFENSRRLTMANMGSDITLQTAKTSTASQAIAEKIISDNERLFKFFDDIATEDFIGFSETERANYTKKLYQLSSSVYSQINDAVSVEQVSREELFNSLDQLTKGVYRKGMESLRAISPGDGVEDFYQKLNEDYFFNLKLRDMRYYQQFDQTSAMGVRGTLEIARRPIRGKMRALNLENLKESAELALEQIDKGTRVTAAEVSGTLEEAVLKILAGQRYLSDDEIFNEEARRQAKILESILFFEDKKMSDRVSDLERAGQISRSTINQIPEGQRRSVEELIETIESFDQFDSAGKAGYSRINKQRLATLFENKLFRRGGLALAALAVGSIAYNKIRDVTHDDVSGPPLLPGGNPYENEFTPDFIPGQNQSFLGQSSSYNSGMSYKVNINGSNAQVEKFNRLAGALVNGNSNTTIYNGLPQVDRNPYVEMGKVF